MSTSTDSILGAFLYETNSLLEQLDSIVLEAEQQNDFSQDDVNAIFRIMHTIKGASAMMEFNSLMKIAHRVEDMYAIIREKSMDIVPQETRPALFDLLFQSIDFFRQEVSHIENEEPLSEDIGDLLQKVNSIIDQITSTGKPKEEAKVEETATTKVEGFPFGLHVTFEDGCGMENLRAFMLANAIADVCDRESFTYVPEDVQSNTDTIETLIENGFLLYFATQADREVSLQVVANNGPVETYELFDVEETEPEPVAEVAPVVPAEPEVQADIPVAVTEPAESKPVAPPPAPVAPKSTGTKESFISVNLNKLDQLAAVVGEIVITESMVTSSPDIKDLKLDAFTKSARQLRKLTDELQDVSMSLRMVPISGTFQKMNRIVRDMCKKLGKQAKLTLIGEETEVDKTIVDCIGDPIMHIVRNSMDHGMEDTPQERIDAGKDPTGEIILSAGHTGSEVIIEIKDNGRGVNYERVLGKAIKNGLASPDVEYSNKDILNFLLMPGFSTNAQVTEFSGRGVGMDVVKRNVEEIGGTVTITSVPGESMTTTLKIPLTMAIMDGMEVSVGKSIFTIPINNIRQSFKIQESDIVTDANGGEMFRCMGNFYPVIRMCDRYEIEGGYTDLSSGILIWLEAREHSYCLFVDELLGEQKVVVKPLPAYLNNFNIKSSGIVGCTIMGDGNISIILDVANLYTFT